MADAESELAPVLHEVDVKMPTTPVIANTTGVAYTSVAQIRQQLVAQVVQPVLWEGSINGIIATGVKELYDLVRTTLTTSTTNRECVFSAPKVVRVGVGNVLTFEVLNAFFGTFCRGCCRAPVIR